MRFTRPVLLAALAAVLLLPSAPAGAAPPLERTLSDPVDAGASYDVLSVRMFAAAKPGKRAKVVVLHDRSVRSGDGLDAWFDLDGDRTPDVYLTGLAFSEYAVYRTSSFRGHGKDISGKDCFSLVMGERRAVLKFEPDCLGVSAAYAVAVRSFRHGEPAAGADWAPDVRRLSGRVASYAPAG